MFLNGSMGTKHSLVLLFNCLGRHWQFEIYSKKEYYCDPNRLPDAVIHTTFPCIFRSALSL